MHAVGGETKADHPPPRRDHSQAAAAGRVTNSVKPAANDLNAANDWRKLLADVDLTLTDLAF
jgi:hypothetical protein